MGNQEFEYKPIKESLDTESMTAEEAKNFLHERGVKSLSINTWQPGTPLLFVFPDRYKNKTTYESFLHKPTIVRIDKATELTVDSEMPGAVYLENEGGQVAYYSIDPETKEIRLVKISNNTTTYVADAADLFEPADHLFPKAEEK